MQIYVLYLVDLPGESGVSYRPPGPHGSAFAFGNHYQLTIETHSALHFHSIFVFPAGIPPTGPLILPAESSHLRFVVDSTSDRLCRDGWIKFLLDIPHMGCLDTLFSFMLVYPEPPVSRLYREDEHPRQSRSLSGAVEAPFEHESEGPMV